MRSWVFILLSLGIACSAKAELLTDEVVLSGDYFPALTHFEVSLQTYGNPWERNSIAASLARRAEGVCLSFQRRGFKYEAVASFATRPARTSAWGTEFSSIRCTFDIGRCKRCKSCPKCCKCDHSHCKAAGTCETTDSERPERLLPQVDTGGTLEETMK